MTASNINIQCVPSPELWVDVGAIGGTGGTGTQLTDENTVILTDESGVRLVAE